MGVEMTQALFGRDILALWCVMLVFTLVMAYVFPNDIRVTEHEIMGPPIGWRFHPVKVSASSVDTLISSYRPVIAKLLGQYYIYNEYGTGVQFIKYAFSRADFKKIKDRINDMLGLDLDRI